MGVTYKSAWAWKSPKRKTHSELRDTPEQVENLQNSGASPARARQNIAFRFCIITDLLQNTGTIYEENKRKHTSIGEGRSLKH